MDTLTRVLVGLYEEPERPSNALDYIRRYLGAPSNLDVESLKKENSELKKKVERLEKELQQLKSKAGCAAEPSGEI
jgi:predicted RNase H-like nuclease (RuvC/YqgF family)